MNDAPLTRPLEAFRVVEVASWAYVPSAGAVLADWGADVIKIEPPEGDPVRGLTSGGVGRTGRIVPMWETFNRGKRSIALDLKHPTGREIIHDLVRNADVFLTNLLPRTRDALGIDAVTIRDVNPRIVYGCGTGQGTRGPDADKGGYDSITFWSRGGISASLTPDDAEPIGIPSGAFGDSLSGMALAGGISAALVRRGATGEGSLVDGSLLGTAMWSMQLAITAAAASGRNEMPRMIRANARNPLVNTYETVDGRWIALCMLQADKYWSVFCQTIGRSDLAADARFTTQAARDTHLAAAIAHLEQTFRSRRLAEWIPILHAQPGQWDIVKTLAEVLDDEQARANGFHQWVDYGSDLRLPLVANPVQFDGEPPILHPAPELGANSEEVLLELGWDWDRILDAKVAGIVL